MSTGRRIQLRGFTVKDGKRVVRDPRALNVNKRLQQRGSKRVRYKRGK